MCANLLPSFYMCLLCFFFGSFVCFNFIIFAALLYSNERKKNGFRWIRKFGGSQRSWGGNIIGVCGNNLFSVQEVPDFEASCLPLWHCQKPHFMHSVLREPFPACSLHSTVFTWGEASCGLLACQFPWCRPGPLVGLLHDVSIFMFI